MGETVAKWGVIVGGLIALYLVLDHGSASQGITKTGLSGAANIFKVLQGR